MNNVNKLKIAVLSVAMFGMVSGVANAATTKGESSIELIKGLSISPATNGTSGSDLYFGQVLVPTAKAATVTVSPKGGSTANGTTALTQGHPATFKVTGIANKTFTVKLDNSSTMKNKAGKSLKVAKFTKSKVSALNKKGDAIFTVGATVSIPKNAAIGIYTGTFGVTVDY